MPSFQDQVQESLGAGYVIDRELGGGGMSRVFVAHDTALRRDIVVKVLPPDLVAGVNLERFRREILVAAGLQHPHIVPVLASGETDGLPWFTMPFVQGESLRERLARGPMPIFDIVNVLREIAKALAYAHERGVVHRDIKPDNVLITGGTAVVTDFGIAKALSASRAAENPHGTHGSLTQVGMSIGTPVYMAPEQAAADPQTDARADLYAFGCVAYELLAGRPPFHNMTPQRLLAAHMADRPQPVLELRRDVPPLLVELVMRCLEKEPSDRPASAAEVVRVLELVATTSAAAAAAPAVLLGGQARLPAALGAWAVVFGAAWLLAKAAIVGIGLPSWVLPGALIVAGLGLPAILFTYIVQRTAHSALVRTPTLTTGGTTAPHGTMATLALKASPHVSWRRTTRGGVLAFAGFIVIVGVVMVLRAFGIGPAASLLASGRITAKEPVLVTDFAVRGADSTLGGIVVEALRASLGQSNAVTLVSPGAVAAALVRMERPPSSRIDLALARDVAQREGIKAIVDGDVAGLGTGYVVSVRLVTADSGRVLTTVQQAVDGPKELIASLDDMGRTLRGRLGESLRSVQDAPRLEEVTTPSLDALREYSEGVRAYDFDADVPGAVAHLKAAIAFDTNFAMAWRKLGVAYTMGGYSTAAADSAGGRAYELRDRLPPAERLVTEGSYFMDGPARNRLRSIAAWDQLLARGDSLPAANDEAELLAQRRQLPRSDSLFRAAIRLNHAPVAYLGLASDQLGEGRAAQALATLDTLIHTRPAASALDASRMERIVIYMTVGDYARAQAMVDTSLGSSSDLTIAGAHHAAMLLAAIEGRLSRVPVEMLATAVATPAVARPTPLFDSMTVALLDATIREQPARAVQRLDASLAAMPFATRPPAERNYYWAATIYALAGRPDRAKGIMAQRNAGIRDTTRLRNEEPQLHRVLGEIALAEGRPNDAVREFWKGDSVSDGPADGCDACTDFALARAYDKANQPDSAVRYFEKYFASTSDLRPDSVDLFARGPAARRLGELYEAAGNRAAAARYYQMFVDLWKNADADLEPQVAEVRRRLARLGKRTD